MPKRKSPTPAEIKQREDIDAIEAAFNTNADMATVARALNSGLLDKEENTVELIKKYLQTEQDRKAMYDEDMSIYDMLNGRYNEEQEIVVLEIFERWNQKLGTKTFGA